MEELNSSNVQIILEIKQGKGLEQISRPSLLTATLNGHVLKTNIFASHTNPSCATNLVWETDKSALRKMRSMQTPIKVEYFVMTERNLKDKVGYLLLDIRTAQIIPKSKAVYIRENWYKLLGLRNELKCLNLEFLISLTIQNGYSHTSNLSCSSSRVPDFAPYLLGEEGLIQLGPLNDSRDLFTLHLTTNYAVNLDLLLLEKPDEEIDDNYIFCFTILDNVIQTKPFIKDTTNTWILNEKIVIRIRSSLSALKCYFQENPYLFVCLWSKQQLIGKGRIDLKPLVSVSSIEGLTQLSSSCSMVLDEQCFLHKEQANEITGFEPQQAYLDIQIKLQYISDHLNMISLCTDQSAHTEKPAISLIQCHEDRSNEALKETAPSCHTGNVNTDHNQIGMCKKSPHDFGVHYAAPPMYCFNNNDSKDTDVYHRYCLHIALNAIQLTSMKMAADVELQFDHPKAEVVPSIKSKISLLPDQTVQLQNVGCQFYFVSLTDKIQNLLLSFPPKLSIFSANEYDRTCLSVCVVDTKTLFEQNVNQSDCMLSLEDTNKCQIGTADITLELEDLGESSEPPIVDDSFTYKKVNELEIWREQQKEIFKVELKKKEERHLSLLSKEWQARRLDLESRLTCSVEQCKVLANTLNKATEDLKSRRLKSLEKEARLIKANEDLQWQYEVKLQELTESKRTMQENLIRKIGILEEKKAALEAQIEPLRIENEKLRLVISEQAKEQEIGSKSSLTPDQTRTLLYELKALEEKLNSVQRSKSFFKEQWGKAVREIHKMKMENQQVTEMHIKNSKEELHNLDLEEILCMDSTALSKDQVLLCQLQKEIDVMKPKSSCTKTNTCHDIFMPINNIFPTTILNGMSAKHRLDEQDRKLHMLIEERDALLKTRSYNMDDAVIIKLNTEIKSLLLNK